VLRLLPARPLVLAIAAPLMLAGALTGTGQAAATSTAACRTFTGAQPPAPASTQFSALTAVTVLSPCNTWAVGSSEDSSADNDHGLIEHWDGAGWTQVPSPEPAGATESDLFGVRAVSPTELWAVGSWFDGTAVHVLILRGNGHSWSVVNSPDPGTTFSTLNAVRAVSAHDVWAVGEFRDSSSPLADQTLILHWNGTSWTRVASPDPAGTTNNNDLNGVAATGPDDAWAVGDINSNTGKTFILHWNGTKWSRVSSPSFQTNDVLTAVGASSRSNVWAVGRKITGADSKTLTLHWDGKSWRRVPSPNETGVIPQNTLSAVAVVSPTSAWAVGAYEGGHTALILRWNGAKWIHQPDPLPESQFRSDLAGVANGPGGSAWAVGSFSRFNSPATPLALHCC
jgi:hypothetical protein